MSLAHHATPDGVRITARHPLARIPMTPWDGLRTPRWAVCAGLTGPQPLYCPHGRATISGDHGLVWHGGRGWEVAMRLSHRARGPHVLPSVTQPRPLPFFETDKTLMLNII